jgi:hypothetical protein
VHHAIATQAEATPPSSTNSLASVNWLQDLPGYAKLSDAHRRRFDRLVASADDAERGYIICGKSLKQKADELGETLPFFKKSLHLYRQLGLLESRRVTVDASNQFGTGKLLGLAVYTAPTSSLKGGYPRVGIYGSKEGVSTGGTYGSPGLQGLGFEDLGRKR